VLDWLCYLLTLDLLLLEVQCCPLVPGWQEGSTVRDMQTHLEKLRVQVAECEMIRDLATDKGKRELFAKLAEHFQVLAEHVELAIRMKGAEGGG
jgi:hypothetical protein